MARITLSFLISAAVALAGAADADAAKYEIDLSHSSIGFKVRHLLSYTTGEFRAFSGTVEVDPENPGTAEVMAKIDAATIDTGDEDRDEHLRNEDFFDVEKFPEITFESTEITDLSEDGKKGKLTGNLTLHGVTKPVTLDVEWLGTATDPWGNAKAGAVATTVIDRKEFGIVWNKALDAGGYVIGDEVQVEINVELNAVSEEEDSEDGEDTAAAEADDAAEESDSEDEDSGDTDSEGDHSEDEDEADEDDGHDHEGHDHDHDGHDHAH